MKRSYFLKQLIALPFGPYVVRKFFLGEQKSRCLLNKFYVAGFQYYGGQSFIEDIQVGQHLKLVAEPGNEYDKFAVAIYHQNTMIGHVPRTDNKHLSRLLRQQVSLLCKVTAVDPKKDTWNMLKVGQFIFKK